MSKMRIIMFALAIGSAVVAGLLAKGVIGKKQEVKLEEVNTVKTTDVLVAAKDLLMGDKLASGTVVWKSWPSDSVLPTMITKDSKPNATQDYADARARLPIYQGETIFEKKILRLYEFDLAKRHARSFNCHSNPLIRWWLYSTG
jgi:pilus assembly protein CpaB